RDVLIGVARKGEGELFVVVLSGGKFVFGVVFSRGKLVVEVVFSNSKLVLGVLLLESKLVLEALLSEDSTNQAISTEQLDDSLWNLPEYNSSYSSSSEYNFNDSISEVISELPLFRSGSSMDTESNFNEVYEPLLANVSSSIEYDSEDYEGASFDDAFNDLQHLLTVEWPNDAYCEFIELVNKHQLSKLAGDFIISFFNKFSKLDISPLPSSTRIRKEFLDNSNIPYMMFKEI
ncbi:188_t:CDS:2, partial [Ambispora leptoticha]